jgi:hypothetical protein
VIMRSTDTHKTQCTADNSIFKCQMHCLLWQTTFQFHIHFEVSGSPDLSAQYYPLTYSSCTKFCCCPVTSSSLYICLHTLHILTIDLKFCCCPVTSGSLYICLHTLYILTRLKILFLSCHKQFSLHLSTHSLYTDNRLKIQLAKAHTVLLLNRSHQSCTSLTCCYTNVALSDFPHLNSFYTSE